MVEYTLTHKGWFGFCPVYYANIDSDCPLVEPRHYLLSPLLDASQFIYDCIGWLSDRLGSDYEMAYPLRITGEIKPFKVSFDD